VEGTFFSQTVVPVPAPLEQQKRPLHVSSRFTLLSQAPMKPGPTKQPRSCKCLCGRYLVAGNAGFEPTASGSGGHRGDGDV
jgi:hypothetical protein